MRRNISVGQQAHAVHGINWSQRSLQKL